MKSFNSVFALITIVFSFEISAALPLVKTGDLILQASNSTQADAIMWATHSQYSHIGIIEMVGGQPFVVEAIKQVSRTPLASWIARGRGGKYTVLRSTSIPENERKTIVEMAKIYLGADYDPFFTFVNDRIYCSELIWLAYQKAGYSIGTIQTVAELDIDHDSVKQLVRSRWKNHPLCAKVRNFDDCWVRILNDKVISPEMIAKDSSLDLVFSNF